MQRDNTARRSCAPENHPTLPASPEPTQPPRTIAVLRLPFCSGRRLPIAVGAIVLIAVCFYWLPALATGLLFGGALFGINTLVDGKMGGRGNE